MRENEHIHNGHRCWYPRKSYGRSFSIWKKYCEQENKPTTLSLTRTTIHIYITNETRMLKARVRKTHLTLLPEFIVHVPGDYISCMQNNNVRRIYKSNRYQQFHNHRFTSRFVVCSRGNPLFWECALCSSGSQPIACSCWEEGGLTVSRGPQCARCTRAARGQQALAAKTIWYIMFALYSW